MGRKKVRYIWIIGIILLAGYLAFAFNEKFLCEGGRATIDCAYKHPSVISFNEFQQYPIFNSALDTVKIDVCKDLKMTAATLGVGAGFFPNNAHYSEEVTEIIDEMLATKPECFLKALNLLDRSSRVKIGAILRGMEGSAENKSKGISSLKKFEDLSEFQATISDLRTDR